MNTNIRIKNIYRKKKIKKEKRNFAVRASSLSQNDPLRLFYFPKKFLNALFLLMLYLYLSGVSDIYLLLMCLDVSQCISMYRYASVMHLVLSVDRIGLIDSLIGLDAFLEFRMFVSVTPPKS